MKILHISTYSSGGAAIAAIKLHENLLRAGYGSKFLFRSGRKKIENGYYWNASFVVQKSKSTISRIKDSVAFRLKRILKKTQKPTDFSNVEVFSSPITEFPVEDHPLVLDADLIVLHWIGGFIDWGRFFKKIKKPIIWYFHDMGPLLGGVHYELDLNNVIGTKLEYLENHFNKIKDHSLKEAELLTVICNSDWLTNLTKQSSRFEQTEIIETLYYSFDFETFNAIEKTEAKRLLQIDKNKINILFGADNNAMPRKGFKILLKALNRLTEKNDVVLSVFGENSAFTESLNPSLQVVDYGKISNEKLLSIIYSSADLFLMPSIQEAFGQTIVESLACGTPVIAFNSGGISEIIQHKINGILVEQMDDDGLYRHLSDTISDSRLLQMMEKNCRNSVVDKFCRSNQIKVFERICNQYLKYLD